MGAATLAARDVRVVTPLSTSLISWKLFCGFTALRYIHVTDNLNHIVLRLAQPELSHQICIFAVQLGRQDGKGFVGLDVREVPLKLR